MASLRQSRLRTGATDWALYQDGQNPRSFIELFSVASRVVLLTAAIGGPGKRFDGFAES
jgi:Transmembrane secretion effector